MDGGRGRERKRVSPFPEPVSLFITIMSALLSPFPPTKISYSQRVTSCGDLAERRAGLRNEASQGSERAGGKRVHLADPVWDGGKASGRHVEDSRAEAVSVTHVFKERFVGKTED